jgi:hypothetical protein
MVILCGYNGNGNLRPETVQALDSFSAGHRVDYVDTSFSPTAYWHAIRDRWTGECDLVTVEQDMLITAENIPSFADCASDWCCYEYPGPDHLPFMLRWSLGCTKFSKELQRKIPAEQIAGDYMVWFLIDERIHKLFSMHGYTPHCHGPVEHLHDYHAETTPEERRDAAVVYNHVFADDVWNEILFPKEG